MESYWFLMQIKVTVHLLPWVAADLIAIWEGEKSFTNVITNMSYELDEKKLIKQTSLPFENDSHFFEQIL